MQIGTTRMPFFTVKNVTFKSVAMSLEMTEGTLHLHTTTCHNCLHFFCVILLFPFCKFQALNHTELSGPVLPFYRHLKL